MVPRNAEVTNPLSALDCTRSLCCTRMHMGERGSGVSRANLEASDWPCTRESQKDKRSHAIGVQDGKRVLLIYPHATVVLNLSG